MGAEQGGWFYLRIEGVNLEHFVYDTQDLSTVRGGSLLLLQATRPEAVAGLLPEGATLVTSGASQAMFRFPAASADAAQDVRARVDAHLRRHDRYATFVVDVQAASDDFVQDREALLARNRWRQMQSLSLAVPDWNQRAAAASGRPYCSIDFVRPAAVSNRTRNRDKQRVSRSVKVRGDYGRRAKQEFYVRELGLEPALVPRDPVAWDFRQIAARGPHCAPQDRTRPDPLRHLDGKIAVLYVDGNAFGAIQRASCTDVPRQQAWDAHVQGMRRAALRRIWEGAWQDPQWQGMLRDEGRDVAYLRFETLLWGGDELIWVVPAWKGWDTLQAFFATARDWPAWEFAAGIRIPLTHAAGLVFCHANAPIHRITALAHELADVAKRVGKITAQGLRSGEAVPGGESAASTAEGAARFGRFRDACVYHVLESFDQLGQSLEDARRRHLPQGCTVSDLVLEQGEFGQLADDVAWMKQCEFPRGSVYRILRLLHEGQGAQAEHWLIRAVREIPGVPCAPDQWAGHAHLSRFWPTPADDEYAVRRKRVRWLHAAELWDYVAPVTEAGRARLSTPQDAGI